jgi:hypothetical protein
MVPCAARVSYARTRMRPLGRATECLCSLFSFMCFSTVLHTPELSLLRRALLLTLRFFLFTRRGSSLLRKSSALSSAANSLTRVTIVPISSLAAHLHLAPLARWERCSVVLCFTGGRTAQYVRHTAADSIAAYSRRRLSWGKERDSALSPARVGARMLHNTKAITK